MPLHVTHRDLANSYARLRDAADNNPGTVSHLLRFYSVECGLKAVALRRTNLQRTDQLPDYLLSHDLRRLAAHFRLNAAEYQQLVDCRRAASGQLAAAPVTVPRLHEAWRYGAGLDPKDEQRCVAGLTSLGNWCRKELGR
ncbi:MULTISPECIES: hypothetical protein [unclassified Micromonospora]|uniref:hypothetical protein n=1 Tax=unclassified Micromonospora TaxID=2617518 RepID=UPI003A89C462